MPHPLRFSGVQINGGSRGLVYLCAITYPLIMKFNVQKKKKNLDTRNLKHLPIYTVGGGKPPVASLPRFGPLLKILATPVDKNPMFLSIFTHPFVFPPFCCLRGCSWYTTPPPPPIRSQVTELLFPTPLGGKCVSVPSRPLPLLTG